VGESSHIFEYMHKLIWWIIFRVDMQIILTMIMIVILKDLYKY